MKTSVILHGLHNEFSFDQMEQIFQLAKTYGARFRHVATGLQIIGIEKDKKDEFVKALPDGVVPVVHRGVNSIIACVGKNRCKNGQMETDDLADYVERKHYGRPGGHKLKIAISGCGRNCGDGLVKDIAFIGTSRGYVLFIGGTTGHVPEKGKLIASNLTVEQAKEAADILVDFFVEHGKPKERLGALIGRLGNPLEDWLQTL